MPATKTRRRDTESAALVNKTSRITGKTKRYVQMVITGERKNDEVLSVYMLLQEGNDALLEEARKMWKPARMGYASSPNRSTRKQVAA